MSLWQWTLVIVLTPPVVVTAFYLIRAGIVLLAMWMDEKWK